VTWGQQVERGPVGGDGLVEFGRLRRGLAPHPGQCGPRDGLGLDELRPVPEHGHRLMLLAA
jgi:hypothetical protein